MDFDLPILRRVLDLPRLRRGDELAPLIELLPASGKAAVVEVGAFAGESASQFLASPRIDRLYCVDAWVGGYDDACDVASKCDMVAARAAFMIRTAEALDAGRCVLMEIDSIDAAARIAPGTIDLVYIDADHRYESVCRDLRAWRAAVRPGGFIAGHDFFCPGHPEVTRAVLEIVGMPEYRFGDGSWATRL